MRRVLVKVKPGSKEELVRDPGDGTLEVRVSVPPEKGKANERLLEVLARHYGVRKSAIRIVRGHTSRTKLIEIDL